MMAKKQVEVEFINRIQKERARINKMDLSNIQFIENDTMLDIPKGRIDEFKLTGLSNIDFITSEFYKYGFVEDKRE